MGVKCLFTGIVADGGWCNLGGKGQREGGWGWFAVLLVFLKIFKLDLEGRATERGHTQIIHLGPV